MEVRRTVPVKLDVDDSDGDLLRETIRQFLDSANYVVDVASEGEWVETRKSVLHDEYKAQARGISVEQISPQYTSNGVRSVDSPTRTTVTESRFRATRADTKTTRTTTPRRTSV